jgi:hypothetical protein
MHLDKLRSMLMSTSTIFCMLDSVLPSSQIIHCIAHHVLYDSIRYDQVLSSSTSIHPQSHSLSTNITHQIMLMPYLLAILESYESISHLISPEDSQLYHHSLLFPMSNFLLTASLAIVS